MLLDRNVLTFAGKVGKVPGKTALGSAADRRSWSFAQLFDWHLDRGTRPGERPENLVGKRLWTKEEFASRSRRDPKTVQNWRKGKTVPSSTDAQIIETILFGEDEALHEWRGELRTAYQRARAGIVDEVPLPSLSETTSENSANASKEISEAAQLTASDAVAAIKKKHDSQGRIVEEAYFGADERPTLGSDGAAKLTWKYDGGGRITELAYFGIDGKPLVNKSGFAARYTVGYDAAGNTIENAFFDPDGQPAPNHEGAARIAWKYDDHGRIIELAYFGPNGKPLINKSGFAARYTSVWDEKGNEIESAFFGVDGNPTTNSEGAIRVLRTYDDRGNAVETKYIRPNSPAAQLIPEKAVATVKKIRDAQGRFVEEAYFDANGNPALGKDGAPRVRWEYDERGRVIAVAYFESDGRPRSNPGGAARITWKFDDQGRTIDQAFFGVDGKAVLGVNEGVARVTWTFDDQARTTEEAYFGVDGEPRAGRREGVPRARWEFDAQGRVIAVSYFDGAGRPMLNPAGVARAIWIYDAHGGSEERRFGVDWIYLPEANPGKVG